MSSKRQEGLSPLRPYERVRLAKKPTMKELVDQSKYQSHEVHFIIGIFLIFIGLLLWFVGFYTIFVSKLLMPHTGHRALDWIKDDYYYCCAIPSWVLLIWAFIYPNWVAMKYFRHN